MRIVLLTQAVPLKDRPTIGLYNVAQVRALKDIGIDSLLLSVAPRLPRGAAVLGGAVRRQALRPNACQFEGVQIRTARARTAFTKTVRHHVATRFPATFAKHFKHAAIKPTLDALSDFKPTAILAHGMLPWGHLALSIGKQLNIPVGFIEHSQGDVLRIKPSTALHRYAKTIASQATCILAVSQRMVDHLSDLSIATPKLLLNGVNTYNLPHALKQPDAPFTILCAGQYIRRKGHKVLIDAFARANLPNTKLKLVGAPPRDIQRAIDAAGIRECVDILPILTNRELIKEMARADLFAMPSWSEAFGLVYMEALSVGTPVLLTTDAGATEHIKHHTHGWIVPPHDPTAVAIALTDAHSSPERRSRMGIAGKQLVDSTFSWKRNAIELADHLNITGTSSSHQLKQIMQETPLLPVPIRFQDLFRKERLS